MLDIAHEQVHIKQYLSGELFEYAAGGVRYKGQKFDYDPEMNDEGYYNSPWEIEAYGREQGMYKMFTKMLKEEAKAKK